MTDNRSPKLIAAETAAKPLDAKGPTYSTLLLANPTFKKSLSNDSKALIKDSTSLGVLHGVAALQSVHYYKDKSHPKSQLNSFITKKDFLEAVQQFFQTNLDVYSLVLIGQGKEKTGNFVVNNYNLTEEKSDEKPDEVSLIEILKLWNSQPKDNAILFILIDAWNADKWVLEAQNRKLQNVFIQTSAPVLLKETQGKFMTLWSQYINGEIPAIALEYFSRYTLSRTQSFYNGKTQLHENTVVSLGCDLPENLRSTLFSQMKTEKDFIYLFKKIPAIRTVGSQTKEIELLDFRVLSKEKLDAKITFKKDEIALPNEVHTIIDNLLRMGYIVTPDGRIAPPLAPLKVERAIVSLSLASAEIAEAKRNIFRSSKNPHFASVKEHPVLSLGLSLEVVPKAKKSYPRRLFHPAFSDSTLQVCKDSKLDGKSESPVQVIEESIQHVRLLYNAGGTPKEAPEDLPPLLTEEEFKEMEFRRSLRR